MNNPADASFDLSALLTQERAAIRMPSAALPDPARAMSGLAFSGGGIRSASFNLGVIQALSEQKLLREFDYLSCVSGGGYIGGWLSAFIHRKCNGRVEDAEALLKTGGDEHPSIRYLRSYSNYLTPRARVFSADTLTAVATYLRNLYLNLTLLLLALTSVLLAPRLLVWTVRELSGWHNGAPVQTWPLWLGGIACAAVAMGFAGVNLGGRGGRGGYTSEPPWYTRQGAVLGVIVAPGLVSAWLISYGIYVDAPALLERSIGAWMLGSTVVYIGAWGIGWAIGRWLEARHTTSRVAVANAAFSRPRLACMGAFAVLAGLIGGALLAGFVQIVALIPRGSEDPLGYFGAWLASALATALLLKFYSLTIISHIGLMGRFFSHDSLEWWSRLGGWVLLFAALWAALFCIVFVAPAFFAWAPQWLLGSGALTWIGATAFGVLFGRRPDTGLALRADWRDLIAKAMPYVFIVGLLGLLSFALHQLLLALACNATLQTLFSAPCAAAAPLSATAWQPYVEVESGQFKTIPIGLVAALCLGSFALATALAWRIDVNLFSIYHFYRQRLVRCYLGASRSKARVPQSVHRFRSARRPEARRTRAPRKWKRNLPAPVSDFQYRAEPGFGQGARVAGTARRRVQFHPAGVRLQLHLARRKRRMPEPLSPHRALHGRRVARFRDGDFGRGGVAQHGLSQLARAVFFADRIQRPARPLEPQSGQRPRLAAARPGLRRHLSFEGAVRPDRLHLGFFIPVRRRPLRKPQHLRTGAQARCDHRRDRRRPGSKAQL
jgi:hypothetical protein